ncbi:hypothetical protein [Streptomyces sp. Z26]|uniref:hypothetical protein n=1 Tax=Streptomyces sp. Z26 TaxID=2500177 RepID=UPI000EF155B3|nr:hypothetical protein [Streptomyces sp. Z26]RLL66530.1 hypothetical protein D7M15_06120 [Streptomyces sp. Z26]
MTDPAPSRRRARAAVFAAARADKATIITRYEAAEPLTRIAATYGVSRTWLRRRLHEWNALPPPLHAIAQARHRPPAHVFRGRRTTTRTPTEVRAARTTLLTNRHHVITRYTNGESLARLAREYRVNPAWLADKLDDWNIPRRTTRTTRTTNDRTP